MPTGPRSYHQPNSASSFKAKVPASGCGGSTARDATEEFNSS
jgi:hypothetical protein